MSGKAAKIQLTTVMQEILRQLASSRTIGNAIMTRAKMILMAFDKHDDQTIGCELERSAKTVGKWRRRWRDSFPALLEMQFVENAAAFRRAIIECLNDAPRSGSPGKFTAEQIVFLIGIACEPPKNSKASYSRWHHGVRFFPIRVIASILFISRNTAHG
ncbi:MAG TPA: hypothetical protein VMM56_03605 [Planctomycetaceae bacterium]|nr:hypothetical protein [Planctomycetaceae bacterium]